MLRKVTFRFCFFVESFVNWNCCNPERRHRSCLQLVYIHVISAYKFAVECLHGESMLLILQYLWWGKFFHKKCYSSWNLSISL